MRQKLGLDGREIAIRNAAAYDRIAPRFAQIHGALPEDIRQAAEEFMSRLPKGSQILDVGCGHGRDMAWFESLGYSVTGIDCSAGMLAEAKKRVTGLLLHAEFTEYSPPANSVDGIWCNASLLHIPRRMLSAVLREFRLWARPNAVFFASMKRGSGEAWREVEYMPGTFRFFAYHDPQRFEALLRKAGWVPVWRRSPADVDWIHFICSKSPEGS